MILRLSAVLLTAMLLIAAAAGPAYGAGTPRVWRVDCGAANKPATDIAETVLHSLAEVNSLALQPGDQLLFRRGTTCQGALTPRGSGSEAQPIKIGSYGEGPRPRIDAAQKYDAAVELRDQQQWEIESVDVGGSRLYGIHVVASRGLLRHIVLRDLTVRGVGNDRQNISTKNNGLVIVEATKSNSGFEDVLIDGVVAHDTSQWAGILVEGATGDKPTRHVIVRNSMAHDVQGDGIALFRLTDGLIENSVAWHTGMQPTETIGTPNAIWTWACTDCIIQNNEAFLSDSPGIDGGGFDIDYGNKNNSVLNNYGHDTQGYCVSVFGAHSATTQSNVSGNLCVRNGMSPRLAERQGAIFLATWEGGSLEGVRVENNTVYFDPPGNYSAIQRGEELNASGIVLEGNTIHSTALAGIASKFKFEDRGNKIKLGEMRSKTSLEPSDKLTTGEATPKWVEAIVDANKDLNSSNHWELIVDLPEIDLPEIEGDVFPRSVVGQLALLRSQALQFRDLGLGVTIAGNSTAEQRARFLADWDLSEDGLTVVALPATGPKVETTVLLDPNGRVAKVWEGALTPVNLGMVLREMLGAPRFAGLPAR